MTDVPGATFIIGAWLLLTPPWHVNDFGPFCPIPESHRPYSEWTRDGTDYPSEIECIEAKERQREDFEFPWRGAACFRPHTDSRVCVPADTVPPPLLPAIEAPPQKVDRVRVSE